MFKLITSADKRLAAISKVVHVRVEFSKNILNTDLPRNSSCYVRANTDALHADFSARGLQLAPPQDREWGMRELYVIDPHGNLLKFGEPL